MRLFNVIFLVAIAFGPTGTWAQRVVPPHVASALADAARPQADRDRDNERKAADILDFTSVEAGHKVADIYPGGGYFTRLFSKAVGPQGQVYGVVSRASANSDQLASNPAFPNIQVIAQRYSEFKPLELLDIIFMSQIYHDLYNPEYGGGDAIAVNKAMFNALKPGGLLVIIDHSAPTGSGLRDIATIHRIDEEKAIQDIVSVGFILDTSSAALRNPSDARTINAMDTAIRGRTDQFILKFRKP